MSEPVEALILDLLEWLDRSPRPYTEVMEAWRTSCPRLPVWEDANDSGYVERQRVAGSGELVTVTSKGRAYLRRHRPFVPQSLLSARRARGTFAVVGLELPILGVG